MSTGNSTLTQDEVFDLLSSARRRYVIYVLRQESEPMKVTELAEEVAAWEHDTTPDDLESQERKRVYVSLYQTHVPKLSEAGIVDYDEDTGLVSLTSRAREVDHYLQEPDEEGLSWQNIYVPLAVLAGGLLLLAEFDVLFFAGVSDAIVSVAVVAAVFFVVAAHYAYTRLGNQSIPSEFWRR